MSRLCVFRYLIIQPRLTQLQRQRSKSAVSFASVAEVSVLTEDIAASAQFMSASNSIRFVSTNNATTNSNVIDAVPVNDSLVTQVKHGRDNEVQVLRTPSFTPRLLTVTGSTPSTPSVDGAGSQSLSLLQRLHAQQVSD